MGDGNTTPGSLATSPLTTGIELADVGARWPVAFRSAILARAAEMLADHVAAHGALPDGVLDLGRPHDRERMMATAAALRRPEHLRDELPIALGSVPVVVSWGGLAAAADVVQLLEGVRAVLAPDGALVFAEPTGRPGIRRLVQASLEARRPEFRDTHLGRDIVAAMREAGLVVGSVHRERLPAEPLLARYLAYGRAVVVPDDPPREQPPAGDPPPEHPPA